MLYLKFSIYIPKCLGIMNEFQLCGRTGEREIGKQNVPFEYMVVTFSSPMSMYGLSLPSVSLSTSLLSSTYHYY